MNYLQTPPPTLRTGEYVLLRGADTEAERTDVQRVLRNNGCKAVRFETITDGRLRAHGYVASVDGPGVVQL
jgi:hypothetical protein